MNVERGRSRVSSHPSSNWLFRDLSFFLPRGEILALLGPNGRGKTTLLKCFAELHRALRRTCRCGRGAIGYVPQQFVTPFDYSVREIVLMGRARHIGVFSNPTSRGSAIADEALAMLGLSRLAERTFTTLSGGERQMVLMARALASGAEIMLLDEPTSALDFPQPGDPPPGSEANRIGAKPHSRHYDSGSDAGPRSRRPCVAASRQQTATMRATPETSWFPATSRDSMVSRCGPCGRMMAAGSRSYRISDPFFPSRR